MKKLQSKTITENGLQGGQYRRNVRLTQNNRWSALSEWQMHLPLQGVVNIAGMILSH